jgi:hypothetical protein
MSEKIDNPQIADLVARDAEKVLAEVSGKLSDVEMAAAEKKAAEYIRKFAPKSPRLRSAGGGPESAYLPSITCR